MFRAAFSGAVHSPALPVLDGAWLMLMAVAAFVYFSLFLSSTAELSPGLVHRASTNAACTPPPSNMWSWALAPPLSCNM